MYNLVIYLYQLGVAVYSLFNAKVRKMWRGERDAFRVLRQKVDPAARYVWFHAASLGEFEQGRPLMEQLRREHPELKILLTFFSPSGYEVRKDYEGADIVCYLPLDTISNARRFLRIIRPEKAFFIKYEFWYNYLHILKHRGVPVYSVSSIFRPDQVFFKWYGRQYGRVLNCFTHFFVQNEQSCELLKSIGITNVTITGDTRFDRVLQIRDAAKRLPVLEMFIDKHPHVFVAGSSWPPDEEIFIRYFKEHPEWKLVIAPHVIGDDHLRQIEKAVAGRRCVRYTTAANDRTFSDATGELISATREHLSTTREHLSATREHLSTTREHLSATGELISATRELVCTTRELVSDADVLIINCFGLLSSIYRYATVAYVGGGFGVGIHNTVEAAVWGVPVIFGPNNQKFQEAQELKACGGGIEINSYDDFSQAMDRFAADATALEQAGAAAGNYVKHHSGATDKILRAAKL